MPKLYPNGYKQTVEDIKSDYPDVMTALHNYDLIKSGADVTCNYCVGGAVQLALGEMSLGDSGDGPGGIFPGAEELADTLHYFCEIPYGEEGVPPLISSGKYPCLFAQHKGQNCFTQSDETAYALADKIRRANDRGDFDEAWSYVEVALDYTENN